MTNSRNIKTVDLIEALRRCATPGVHCDGCVFCSDEDHEEPWCGDVLLQEAVRRLEEYTDRCARYAEEIAVLKAAGERVEWIPVTEPPKKWRSEDGDMINYLVYVPEYGVDIGNYGKPAKCWLCMGLPCKPTHWAHLPTPPKGE